MEANNDTFNLHETLQSIWQAIQSTICHIVFDFAIHGLVLALILVVIAILFKRCKRSHADAIMRVAKRLSIFCLLFSIPGSIYWLMYHCLPPAGIFNFNSIGLLCFWGLICTHLVAEEINNSIVKKRNTNAETAADSAN